MNFIRNYPEPCLIEQRLTILKQRPGCFFSFYLIVQNTIFYKSRFHCFLYVQCTLLHWCSCLGLKVWTPLKKIFFIIIISQKFEIIFQPTFFFQRLLIFKLPDSNVPTDHRRPLNPAQWCVLRESINYRQSAIFSNNSNKLLDPQRWGATEPRIN